MNKQKQPLFRKVNTTARGVRHDFGSEFRYDRNGKQESVEMQATRGAMHAKVKRGLDYTPLYKFLLSKVGQDWTAVKKEAQSRLDKEDAIYSMVVEAEDVGNGMTRMGESSYYSLLIVDENNILRKAKPELGPQDVEVWCKCCTYTFNGLPVLKEFKEPVYA